MKQEYTEKQKETIRGAAMLIYADRQFQIDLDGHAACAAIERAKSLINELIEHGLCD